MKTAVIPVFCGLVLTAISATGIGHWWSVKKIVTAAAIGSQETIVAPPMTPEVKPPAPAEIVKKAHEIVTPAAPVVAAATPPASEEFYRNLLSELNNLRNQNRDLRDQMAETNRDLMKLEFRVDTHSESFRPLPVSEERNDTTLDTSTGVLPPLDDSPILPVR